MLCQGDNYSVENQLNSCEVRRMEDDDDDDDDDVLLSSCLSAYTHYVPKVALPRIKL